MEFEWDEEKRQANLAKHGIDFVDARPLFDGRPVWTAPSTYPHEARYVTVGLVDDRFISVVWTRRSVAIRIISARRTRSGERRAYRALHG